MIYIVTYIKLLSMYEYLGYIYVCISRYIYLKYIPSGSPICVVFLASTQMCIPLGLAESDLMEVLRCVVCEFVLWSTLRKVSLLLSLPCLALCLHNF